MSTETPEQLVINTDDLTLAELDRVAKLEADGRCGRTTAIVYVWLKREHPGTTVAEVQRMRIRHVDLVDDSQLGADTEGPTTGH